MDVTNEIGAAEIQLVITPIDVHAALVEHGTHRAVKDVDAVGFQKLSKIFHVVAFLDFEL